LRGLYPRLISTAPSGQWHEGVLHCKTLDFGPWTLDFGLLQHHISAIRTEALADKVPGFVRGEEHISRDNIVHRSQSALGNTGPDRFDHFLADTTQERSPSRPRRYAVGVDIAGTDLQGERSGKG